MKLYKIYYKQEPENLDKMDPMLYAFTTEKDLLKEFVNTRSKKHFAVITKEGEKAKNDYVELMKGFSNKRLKVLTMKTKDYDSIKGYRKISIVGSGEEEMTLMKTIEDYIVIFGNCFKLPPDLIKKEYKEPFETMKYPLMHVWHGWQDTLPFSFSKDQVDFMDLKKELETITFDEFEIFMMRYGGTFRNPD